MASEKGDLPPAEIMGQIQANAQVVNKLATDLTERIKRFEDWFNELPGRVETHWSTYSPSGGSDCTIALRFHRSGKRWIISYDYDGPDRDPGDIDWTPLTDASIEEKLAAIDSFPKVLSSMLEAQRVLTDRLRQAHAKFDALASALEAARKGGA